MKGPKPQQRLAAAPLLALAGNRDGQRNLFLRRKRFRLKVRAVYRFIRDGLTWTMADRLAIRLGYHPAEIWGHEWWALNDSEVAYLPVPLCCVDRVI